MSGAGDDFAGAEAELRGRVDRSGSWFQRLQLAHKVEILRQSGCLSLLSPNGTALDLGCGTGLVACMLALAFPEKQVIGVDSNENRIRACRKLSDGIANVRFLAADVRALDLQLSQEIICFDVLHHLPESAQDRLIENVAEKLEPGGRFIVFEVDTDPSPKWKYWISFLSDYVLYPFQDKAHFRSPAVYEGAFRRAGLELETTRALPSPLVAPIFYVARRPQR